MKCGERAQCYRQAESLPSRERGLKSSMVAAVFGFLPSLPSRERGLKLIHYAVVGVRPRVAPLAGARIEISIANLESMVQHLSLPSRERGLKSENEL